MENTDNRVELQILDNAFDRQIRTFALLNKYYLDIQEFLKGAFRLYRAEIKRTLEQHNIVKSLAILVVEFEKKIPIVSVNGDGNDSVQTIKETLYFTTPNYKIDLGSNIKKHYKKNITNEIMKSVDEAALRGSGFSLSRIIRLDVQIYAYRPLRGSSYIETPKKLLLKKALVNVKNEHDEMCFKWAVLSALHPTVKNPQRLQNYSKYQNELDFAGIDFPVHLSQIKKFESQNRTISINIYYYDDDKDCVYPLRMSGDVKKNHIHLLLLIDESDVKNYGRTMTDKIKSMINNEQIHLHYCWIKNLSRLVGGQLNKREHKNHMCDRCLNYFDQSEKLSLHLKHCASECQIEMPTEKNNLIEFKNYRNQLKAPFVIYADTEAYLKQLNDDEQKHVFSEKCKTSAYQEHHMYSVGYYFKCEFDDSKSYYASSGNTHDCVSWFVQELETIAQYAANVLSVNEPMLKLTDEEERLCGDPDVKCFICGFGFKTDEMRARDHCHFTGKFRGITHTKCNLDYKFTRHIPVIIHNLSGYDAHLFIKQLATQIQGEINIIPINSEQYISFTKVVWNSTLELNVREKIRLKFIDSFRFMSDSLSKLASLIPSDKKRILHSVCRKDYSPEQITMLERKGVFPYDYVNSIERLSETSLPAIEQFYNKLNEENISPKEYQFACDIWKKFQLKTLGEYSLLYLKTDVLLLADIFESFRDVCHTIYGLDPTHYYTAPGFSWDAMLKNTGVNIQLLTDIEMLIFIERGIRGGISQCSKRYVKANNKYMKTKYKPNKETNYLMYLDGKFERTYIHTYFVQ